MVIKHVFSFDIASEKVAAYIGFSAKIAKPFFEKFPGIISSSKHSLITFPGMSRKPGEPEVQEAVAQKKLVGCLRKEIKKILVEFDTPEDPKVRIDTVVTGEAAM